MSERPNMEQLDALADWNDLYHEWEAEPWEDGKPPWMLGEPCPAPADGRKA